MKASRRRVTVLHILEDLGIAGAEGQLTAFLVRSNQTRFQHAVCAFSTGGRFEADLETSGIRVHIMGLPSGRDLIRPVLRLRRLVDEIRPDILHATLYRPGVVSRFVGRLSSLPVVTSLVNTTYDPEWYLDNPRLTPLKAWATRTLDGVTARWWGTRFVALCESVKTSAVRRLGLSPETICVIPRGLSFDGPPEPQGPDSASLRAAYGWTEDYPLILNVARLVPQKGQQYAILAMKDVVKVFPRARLIIAGDGWLRPELERLILEQGLKDHVTLLGERRDVPGLLRAADIFVFPSIYEGMGNALLEALAAGKPCVVSRISVLCEVTGNGRVALLADLRSPASLAANLSRLATDRGLAQELGEAGRAWVRARYDIRNSVVALEALYEELAAHRVARTDTARASA